ncbi:MAG: hypothetical protein GY717_07680 [Rhodobacteraceae bacterium]|nr:hypothetical protein [Paracoccaceae bacterium]
MKIRRQHVGIARDFRPWPAGEQAMRRARLRHEPRLEISPLGGTGSEPRISGSHLLQRRGFHLPTAARRAMLSSPITAYACQNIRPDHRAQPNTLPGPGAGAALIVMPAGNLRAASKRNETCSRKS